MENFIYKRMWKHSFAISGRLRFLLSAVCLMVSLGMSLTGCVSDIDENSQSIANINDSDVESYGDLFRVFWQVMNERYCAINEQGKLTSLSWDEVYDIYMPKFDELKSFQHTYDFTQEEILADNAKAKEYFKEIVGDILDQHFYVKVTLPVSHSSFETETFRSSLHEKEPRFPLQYHIYYMKDLLHRGIGIGYKDFCLMGGFMNSDPDTYYLGFNIFRLSEFCHHTYQKGYLPSNDNSVYHLGYDEIYRKAEMLVANPDNLPRVVSEAGGILADINSYLGSDEVGQVCSKMVAYSSQGNYYDLNACAERAVKEAPAFILNSFDEDADENISDVGACLSASLSDEDNYNAINAEQGFKDWFCNALAQYLWNEREFNIFWNDMMFSAQNSGVEYYRRYFLEPLIAGDIKKLIIDLRSNQGGYLTDSRLLTDYLINKTETFAYFRKKEDNNPYSYTPWVPQQIMVTEKSLQREIPIVILLDNYSISMAEMTTLMLKSQGDHVKTVGRNSSGGQCILINNNQSSNGGWQGDVTSYLNFYMPVCMAKDTQGNLLESKGITPDYIIDAMSEEEINDFMKNKPGIVDRGIQKALEILR